MKCNALINFNIDYNKDKKVIKCIVNCKGCYPKISVQSNHPFKRMPRLFSLYWVQIIQINLSVGTLGVFLYDVIVKRFYWRAVVGKGLTKLWRHFGLVSLVLHLNETDIRQVDKRCTGGYHQ